MPLYNAEKSFRDTLASASTNTTPTPLDQLQLADLRASVSGLLSHTGSTPEIPTEEKSISARDGSSLRVRIYNAHLKDEAILVFYPGCGYILPAFELNAIAAARIAKDAQIKVVVVDFKLAPERAMPKPILDCYDVTKYIYQHPDEFDFNQSQFFIAGLSSGAHTALNISIMSKDDPDLNIARSILINGYYDMWTRFHEQHGDDWLDDEEKQDYLMPQTMIEYQFNQLDLSEEELKSPLISPLLSANLSSLPPITLIITEYDALRTDSERLSKRLTETNTPHEKLFLESQTHNTMILRGTLDDGPDPSNVAAEAIKRHLTSQAHNKPMFKPK